MVMNLCGSEILTQGTTEGSLEAESHAHFILTSRAR